MKTINQRVVLFLAGVETMLVATTPTIAPDLALEGS